MCTSEVCYELENKIAVGNSSVHNQSLNLNHQLIGRQLQKGLRTEDPKGAMYGKLSHSKESLFSVCFFFFLKYLIFSPLGF